MSSQVNGIVLREDFRTAVKIFNNAFNPNNQPNWDATSAFQLTQSIIRLEQPFVTTSTLYKFPILSNIQNQAQQYPTETRLNLQDSFVPTRLGVYVAPASSAADTTFPLFTTFNPTVFGAADSIAMTAFYNGYMDISINNKLYITKWGLSKHRNVNQTQQTVSPLVAGDLEQQFDGSVDGTYPMQPFLLLLGSQNINISITLPAALTAVTANSRIVLIFEGVLAQNSTVVN